MLTVQSGNEQRMSSLEISELMDKRHDHVMRDIKKLISEEAITAPRFGVSKYKDASGKSNVMYVLDFQATMTLITGYDARRRSAVIARWTELERQRVDPMAALNDPATMRKLLLGYAEKVLALEEEKMELLPKAAGLDRLSNADGMMCVTDAAKQLQIKPKKLFGWMSQNGWIYRRLGKKNWLAYQLRIQQGLLAHKVTVVPLDDGDEKVVEAVKVTAKGLAKLAEIFGAEDE